MHSEGCDVFISYSHEDRELVGNLAALLEGQGVRVWMDALMMRPGDVLRDRILEGIESADYFLIVCSLDSLRSRWVQHELNAVLTSEIEQGRVRVIPALAPGVEPDMLPADLRAKDILDLRSSTKTRDSVQRIVRLIGRDTRRPVDPTSVAGEELEKLRRIVARGDPVAAPPKALLLARSFLARGERDAAMLELRRAVDFEGSPVEVSAARELARLLAEDRAHRQAAEVCLLVGAGQELGIPGVDYYLRTLPGRTEQLINGYFDPRPARYFIQQLELLGRCWQAQRNGSLLRFVVHEDVRGNRETFPVEELADPVFGNVFDNPASERDRLQQTIIDGDADAAPTAAYEFGELLEAEHHGFQAEGAFEWARESRHPEVFPRASLRLAKNYASGPLARRYLQAAISFGDGALARAAAGDLAARLDQAGDTENARSLRQEFGT